MDTLRGSLETFGLPEIVRLVASSGRTGALKVDSFRLKGRIFIADGSITYATTRGEDGNIDDLKHMTTSTRRPLRERRGRRESSAAHSVDDLIEQQIVEVFVRLMRLERGNFGFEEGARTRAYGDRAALALGVDKIIEQAHERIAEWESIESLVPSASTRFRLNPDLGNDDFEVTLDARSWSFLASVGDAASVGDLAERLRIFEFPAARKVSEFVRKGLLVAVETRAEAVPPAPVARDADREPAIEGPEGEAAPVAHSAPPQPEHGEPEHGEPEHGEPEHGEPEHGEPEHGEPEPPRADRWSGSGDGSPSSRSPGAIGRRARRRSPERSLPPRRHLRRRTRLL